MKKKKLQYPIQLSFPFVDLEDHFQETLPFMRSKQEEPTTTIDAIEHDMGGGLFCHHCHTQLNFRLLIQLLRDENPHCKSCGRLIVSEDLRSIVFLRCERESPRLQSWDESELKAKGICESIVV